MDRRWPQRRKWRRRAHSVVRKWGSRPSGVFGQRPRKHPQTPANARKRPQTPSNTHKHPRIGRNRRKHPPTPTEDGFGPVQRQLRLRRTPVRSACANFTQKRGFAGPVAARGGSCGRVSDLACSGSVSARTGAVSRGSVHDSAPARSEQAETVPGRRRNGFCRCLWVLTPIATCL